MKNALGKCNGINNKKNTCDYIALLSISYYSDVIISPMASQITGVWSVCSTVCSGADQRKYQSSASLAFVRGIHRWPMDSPLKGQQREKCFLLKTSSWWYESAICYSYCICGNTLHTDTLCHLLNSPLTKSYSTNRSLAPKRNSCIPYGCRYDLRHMLCTIKVKTAFHSTQPINATTLE